MKSHEPWLDILDQIKKEISPGLIRKHQLHSETGDWLDSAVLKLQKPSWTDGGIGQGVFFSVWLGDKELKKNRFNYNVHALKLRLRKGYSIKSGEFAAAFRARREFLGGCWPNVRTDYGPQTLMQGWLPLHPATFHADVRGLVDRFVVLHKVLDEMLEERRKICSPDQANPVSESEDSPPGSLQRHDLQQGIPAIPFRDGRVGGDQRQPQN